MWNFWLKMAYSSDDDTIPTWEEWALIGDKLKFNNKSEYIIDLNTVTTIEIITEENKKKVMGTMMGGGAGLLLLGPLGAIGGLLLGGNKKLVNIAVALNDGRNFVATCTTKTHLSLLKYAGKGGAPVVAVATEQAIQPEKKLTSSDDTKECPMCAETVKAKAKICRFCKHEFDIEAENAKKKAQAEKIKATKEKSAKAKAARVKAQKEIADKKKAVADKKRVEKERIAKYKASKTWEHNIITEALKLPADESETPFYKIKKARNEYHAIKNSSNEYFSDQIFLALKDKGFDCCTSGANLLAMLSVTENIDNISITTPITLLSAINNSVEKLSLIHI